MPPPKPPQRSPDVAHRGWQPLGLGAGERAPAAAGFLFFFCLFASYFMLRPVRETMGIAGGVQNLQWLFTATFVVMLAAIPIYGLCSARLPRQRFVTWVYAFFIANLVAFALVTRTLADSVWVARVFYVWLSVFNLFVVSVGWSLMADAFRPDQARRLFPLIAAGASVGGLVGPLLSAWLVEPLGLTALMLLSALLLAGTLPGAAWLFRWRARGGAGAPDPGPATEVAGSSQPGGAVPDAHDDPRRPIGGGLLAGVTLIARSRYLLGVALFVILLSTANTFLYFEQARLVAESFPDRAAQTRVFGIIDAVVQGGTILVQLFFSGQVARRHGVTPLLTIVPLGVALGFAVLAFWPVFGVLAAVMVLRRIGEYALVRPGREMLFTVVDTETKYKAKNVIDTMVYRAGDAVSAWIKTAIDAVAGQPAIVAGAGAVLALGWAGLGLWLGQRHERSAAARRDSARPLQPQGAGAQTPGTARLRQ